MREILHGNSVGGSCAAPLGEEKHLAMSPSPTMGGGATAHRLPGKLPKTEFGGKEWDLLLNGKFLPETPG